MLDYPVRLVFATREPGAADLAELGPLIAHGASPRATLALLSTGRALALLRGRRHLLPQGVYDVGRDVLRHRVLLTYEALADGVAFEAASASQLSSVYDDIQGRVGYHQEQREILRWFVGAGVIALIAGAAASMVWSGRFL